MKKIIILLLFVVGIFTFVSAQSLLPSGYHNFDQSGFSATGFDGNKPLKKDKMVDVTQTTVNGSKIFLELHQAYKGETKETFLKRFKETFLYQKSTPTLKSQLRVKTASILSFSNKDSEKVPTWVFNVLIGLLIFVVLWGMFGEVDKDPRSMTPQEKDKWLRNYEKEQAAIDKRVRKGELKKIARQLNRELKKPVL